MKEQFIKDFAEVFNTVNDFDNKLAQKHIEKYHEMDAILPPSTSFFIISNTAKQIYPFVSKNFSLNLGLSIEQMNKIGLPYWLQHFHPDDIETWVMMLADLMDYTMTEIAPEDRFRTCYTWNQRVRDSQGIYHNIHEHMTPLVLDDNAKPIIGVAYCTLFGNGQNYPMTATIKQLNENGEYETLLAKNYSQKVLTDGLTNRERDVLRLLALNKTSKEIADSLFISVHTVDTHRRNIIKKLNLKSTNELIGYYKLGGIY